MKLLERFMSWMNIVCIPIIVQVSVHNQVPVASNHYVIEVKWSQGTGLVMRIPKITLGSQNGGQTAEWWPIENRQNFANLELGNDGFNLVWRPSYATFLRFLFSARSGNEIRRMSFFLSSLPVP